MKESRKGMLLVVSGPSGTGKGTLIQKLMDKDPSFVFSVSATTRAPRDYEIPDVHYHFISEEKYDELVAEDAFLEHAGVFGKRYGTLKSEVYERIERGENVLLDIDVQGALQVMEKEKECVSVFILPPSLTELRKRLTGRGTEDAATVERRLAGAEAEIALKDRYTYLIVNDCLEEAAEKLVAITAAEKQRSNRYFPQVEA